MEQLSIIASSEKEVARLFGSADCSKLLYHSHAHTCEVTARVIEISKVSTLSEAEKTWLLIAAHWHDVGYLSTYHEHEEKGMDLVALFLEEQGVAQTDIDFVRACIEATKLHQTPRNLAESILSDADLAYGVTNHFFERGPLLRKEWELCLGKSYSDVEWEQLQLSFLPEVQFFSPYGQTYYAPIVKANLKKQQICLDALIKE
jgi:predicted metal-dependent HD superfamily phosphohydrolase